MGRSRTRRKLWEQSPYCYLCGIELRIWQVTIDHVIPISKGGPDVMANMKTCCLPCNRKKGDKIVPEGTRYKPAKDKKKLMVPHVAYEVAEKRKRDRLVQQAKRAERIAQKLQKMEKEQNGKGHNNYRRRRRRPRRT